MSWRAAGISFLTYQQLCASAVREALKEPMRAKKIATEGHHVRLMKYEGGKRTKTGKRAGSRRGLARVRCPVPVRGRKLTARASLPSVRRRSGHRGCEHGCCHRGRGQVGGKRARGVCCNPDRWLGRSLGSGGLPAVTSCSCAQVPAPLSVLHGAVLSLSGRAVCRKNLQMRVPTAVDSFSRSKAGCPTCWHLQTHALLSIVLRSAVGRHESAPPEGARHPSSDIRPWCESSQSLRAR